MPTREIHDASSGSASGDSFLGLAGNDTIDGRGGFDTALYSGFNTTGGVSIDMASGTVTGDASVGTDTLHDIEAVQGTNFADTYVATGYGQAGALNVSTSTTRSLLPLRPLNSSGSSSQNLSVWAR